MSFDHDLETFSALRSPRGCGRYPYEAHAADAWAPDQEGRSSFWERYCSYCSSFSFSPHSSVPADTASGATGAPRVPRWWRLTGRQRGRRWNCSRDPRAVDAHPAVLRLFAVELVWIEVAIFSAFEHHNRHLAGAGSGRWWRNQGVTVRNSFLTLLRGAEGRASRAGAGPLS